MDKNELLSIISQIVVAVSPLVLSILTWLCAELARLINAKVKDANTRNILNRLDDSVFMVVRELEQVMVEKLKAANADGKLTDQEVADIKKAALDNLFKYMGAEVNNLPKMLGLESDTALREFIKGRIEAGLHAVRNKK